MSQNERKSIVFTGWHFKCIDEIKHQGMRKRLIMQIKEQGISDEKILDALGKIPRHCFVIEKSMGETAYLSMIYDDIAFPIGEGQTISQPTTVAFQTQLLELKKDEKVLEIGTGSGYQTTLLSMLGVKVFSIERQKKLYEKTKIFLPGLYDFLKLANKAKLFYGDGYAGLAAFEQYDKILVTAGAPHVPEALKKQLKIGGVLVIPVNIMGEENTQRMLKIRKKSETEFETEEHGFFRFVPLLEDKNWGNQAKKNLPLF